MELDKNLRSLLSSEIFHSLPGIMFEGLTCPDLNVPGNKLIVCANNSIFSVSEGDIQCEETISNGLSRIHVRNGARIFENTQKIIANGSTYPIEQMEFIRPPALHLKGDALNVILPALSLVGAKWNNSCSGNDSYPNNCAHFLSDAFIRAGYTELSAPNDCIHARCDSASRRPVRARDMWDWFKSKATKTSRTRKANTGWWAIFQLNEAEYWGGHVVLWDSDTDTKYGTSWWPDWDQYLYQW